MKSKSTAKGYMLLEVLIALAIIALVLPPLLLTAAERLRALKNMEDELIAAMVARNQVAQLRLASRLNGDRPERRSDGSELMAQREWFWRASSEPTEVPGYFRLEVIVGTESSLEVSLAKVFSIFGEVPSGGGGL